jgi:glycine betaine/choline ABC-type transport system substrate-binding protein
VCGAVALAGCSGPKPIAVGSKNFTEQLVLGEIVAQQVESRLRTKVERRFNLGGSLLAHQAMLAKEIDVYPEYTGTAYMAILKHPPVSDPALVLDRVRAEYASSYGFRWGDPLGFNNSFAMVVRGDEARREHLSTIADAESRGAPWTLGVGYEFFTRPDGFDTLMKAYPGLRWTALPKTMDLGLLYRALGQKQVDMAAGNSTDGLLSALDLKALADNRNAFPPYQASIVARFDALRQHPGLEEALDALSGRIDAAAMQKMNYEVDGEHRPVRDVAADFLRGIKPARPLP